MNLSRFKRSFAGVVVLAVAAISFSSSELVMPFAKPDLTTAHNPFSFIVYGDVQDSFRDGHRKLVDQMQKERVALILSTGDISANDGKDYDDHFYPVIRNLATQVPFFPAAGNHDVEFLSNTGRRSYRDFFRNAYDFLAEQPFNHHLSEDGNQRLWYAFRYATAFFIVLDSNLLIDSGRYKKTNDLPPYRSYQNEQLIWVRDVLQKTDQDPSIKYKFVLFHHSPFYSKRNQSKMGIFGGHEDDRTLLIQAKAPPSGDDPETYLLDLFRLHRVNAILTGHQHYYERWAEKIDDGNGNPRTLNWIIVGSGGVKPRDNVPFKEKEEINELFQKGELYRHYLDRISTINPQWSARMERAFPNEQYPSGAIQDYVLIHVEGDDVRFQTTDSLGTIQDAGTLVP